MSPNARESCQLLNAAKNEKENVTKLRMTALQILQNFSCLIHINSKMPGVKGNEKETNMDQPRQPTNLQGLLRFSMEATRSEDSSATGSGETHFAPMDEEVKLKKT